MLHSATVIIVGGEMRRWLMNWLDFAETIIVVLFLRTVHWVRKLLGLMDGDFDVVWEEIP